MCFFRFSLFPCFQRGDIEARMAKPRKNHVLQSVFFSLFPLSLLPQGWHRGPYGQTTKKPRFTKCGFFVFSSFLASHTHRGDIEARMGKPRKNHVLQNVFFSFFPPSLLPQGWHRGPYGQTRKKQRFTKCGFFVFSAFLASHRGDIEARMGKPRKNHVLQSVVFSFFLPSLLPTEVT